MVLLASMVIAPGTASRGRAPTSCSPAWASPYASSPSARPGEDELQARILPALVVTAGLVEDDDFKLKSGREVSNAAKARVEDATAQLF